MDPYTPNHCRPMTNSGFIWGRCVSEAGDGLHNMIISAIRQFSSRALRAWCGKGICFTTQCQAVQNTKMDLKKKRQGLWTTSGSKVDLTQREADSFYTAGGDLLLSPSCCGCWGPSHQAHVEMEPGGQSIGTAFTPTPHRRGPVCVAALPHLRWLPSLTDKKTFLFQAFSY